MVGFRDRREECGELGYLFGGERAEDFGLVFHGQLPELAEGCVAGGR